MSSEKAPFCPQLKLGHGGSWQLTEIRWASCDQGRNLDFSGAHKKSGDRRSSSKNKALEGIITKEDKFSELEETSSLCGIKYLN